MLKSIARSELVRPIAWAAAVVTLSIYVVRFFTDILLEEILEIHAESSAVTWRAEFTDSVPNIGELAAGVPASPEQIALVTTSMSDSDIFRFELFDTAGSLIFVADETTFDVDTMAAMNPMALDILRSRESVVGVTDGRSTPHRPDWYVWAYLPVFDNTGAAIAVVEVYVDVTGQRAALARQVDALSLLLICMAAIVYLIPTFVLIRRSRQLRARDEDLIRMSLRDPLTGLNNRAAFNDHAAMLFDPNRPDRTPVGVLYIDLDRFKEINDSLGHDVGDQMLAHVAGILNDACRLNDFVARIGGDEFIIVSTDLTETVLKRIGERILDRAFTPMKSGTHEIHPSFSIGAYLSPPGEMQDKALARADLAVYKAKADGRSRLVMFDTSLEHAAARRRAIAQYLQDGIAQGHLFIEYQPIVSAKRAPVGFEALMRLKGPDGVSISPAEFIPIAEDGGLIEDLGRWVLKEAITAAAQLPEELCVAVNVSPHEFRRGDLSTYLEQILATTDVAPHRIYLEVRESTLLVADMDVERQLAELRAIGIRIALDDFGTGLSSLTHLWQFRFDRIKIDRAFTAKLDQDDTETAHMVETIAVLGRQVGTDVVAEGIESEAQLRAARAAGCDYFQGFLFARPSSFDTTLELVVEQAETRLIS